MDQFMNTAYLLTGGNTGNRLENLETAATLIGQQAGTIRQKSAVYATSAWGYTDQPDFYNQVLMIHTPMDPQQLLDTLLSVEQQLGRKRVVSMGPRNIDIDILLFNNDVIDQPGLTIPHPRLHLRKFALVPLAGIAPGLIHPVFHKTISALLEECTDTGTVHKIE